MVGIVDAWVAQFMSDIVEIMNFAVDLASGVFTNKPSGAESLLRGESYHRVANNH